MASLSATVNAVHSFENGEDGPAGGLATKPNGGLIADGGIPSEGEVGLETSDNDGNPVSEASVMAEVMEDGIRPTSDGSLDTSFIPVAE